MARSALATLAAPNVVDDGIRRASGDMKDQAVRLAAGLASAGVGPGDVVAWWLPNWWEAIACYHACWQLDATAAPLHHRLSLMEAEALVRRLSARAVLVGEGMPHLRGALTVRGIRSSSFTGLLGSPIKDRSPQPLPDAHGEVPERDGGPGPDAVLLATSGSSGVPKIVRHTAEALAYKAELMVRVHGLTSADVVLLPAPLAHVSGLLNGVLLPGAAGMTTVLMDRWSPAHALELIERERVSFMIGPTTFFVQLMADPGFSKDRVASVRLISSGGAGVTREFAERAAREFGAVVKRTYGSTEAPTVTTAHAGDPVERGWATDGRPVGDVEVRVDDGEIVVRGSELFAGYLGGAAHDPDDWFRTGDAGSLDDQGWLTLTGRLSDIIIRGGENISPADVEAACAGLPGVHQCVVVGVPDDVYGERVGLAVIADRDIDVEEVAAHCAAVGLARFKTPERVLRITELPVLTVGKPDRAALREMF